MSNKKILKGEQVEAQENLCIECGLPVDAKDMESIDIHRKVPKRDGGFYIKENVEVLHPRCHMKRHGILKMRVEEYEALKALNDDRHQWLKIKLKFENQLRAFKKRQTDFLLPDSVKDLEAQLDQVKVPLAEREDALKKMVTKLAKNEPLMKAVLGLKLGCGPVTLASMVIYIDLSVAKHPSSLWKYVGLDKPGHERYTDGEASGGNKTLRTALYVLAGQFMKDGARKVNPYEVLYRQARERSANSMKMTKEYRREKGAEKGNMVSVAWKDASDGHQHGDAIRRTIKAFLADYWYVGRTILGLPTSALYVQDVLAHGGILDPESRGWKWVA